MALGEPLVINLYCFPDSVVIVKNSFELIAKLTSYHAQRFAQVPAALANNSEFTQIRENITRIVVQNGKF